MVRETVLEGEGRARGASRSAAGGGAEGGANPGGAQSSAGPLAGGVGSERLSGGAGGRHGAGAALRDLPEPWPQRLQPGGAAGRSRARAPGGAAALSRWAPGPLGAGWARRGSGGCASTCGRARAPGSGCRGHLPLLFRRPGARVGSTWVPRLWGGLGRAGGAVQTRRGGRPAAVGAEHGAPVAQSFRLCPSCGLRHRGAGA